MITLAAHLEMLSSAASPNEYLKIQCECLAVANEEEILKIAGCESLVEARRLDLLQLLYWLTPPSDRVGRFQSLFEEAAEADREFMKALLFRAITERTVRSSTPDRVDWYLHSVRAEFARSLFVARDEEQPS